MNALNSIADWLVNANAWAKSNDLSNWGGVSVSRRREVAPCCALDEGRPLGVALQEETSNHHERLLFNGGGRERHGQKARLDRVRYG